MATSKSQIKKAFIAAFPHTIPILAGFSFLGISYGIYMSASGFSFVYSMLMSITIFAGSGQFVAVGMLTAAFNPIQTLAITLMVNARHLFYAISMLDKYRGKGWKTFYMFFGMCDETFSINYATAVPEGVDAGWFMFFVTLLDHIYWITGSAMGGIFGSFIHFSTEGIEFVMMAIFVVIFMEQWKKDTNHASALMGIFLSLLCLLAFGADYFIIPSMIAILGMLTLLRKSIEKEEV